ncbi:SIR2 family protein [Hoeflea sp. CAU 1731]
MESMPTPRPTILLTGAGFSRNWGGWLASEAFEYLLGSAEINPRLNNLLWNCYDNRTGFEGALARLQKKPKDAEDLRLLTMALSGMFDQMNSAFPGVQGPDLNSGHKASKFLARFDAIFTLNQDLLLEKGYRPTAKRRWSAFRLPGTKLLETRKGELWDLRIPDERKNFKVESGFQPYFKLHGSSAFRSETDTDDALLIMGGEKLAHINGSELLTWYREEFERYLAIPDTRLLIVGYSFADQHINDLLRKAATGNTGLKMFIIDPAGVDVLDKRPMGSGLITPNRNTNHLLRDLTPVVAGASRRGFSSLFNGDDIEFAKVRRFLEI